MKRKIVVEQAHTESSAVSRKARYTIIKAIGVVAVALTVANCSSGKSNFSSSNKYGVKASPRVIAEGEPVPKGGGRFQIGKPYIVAGKTYVPQQNPNYSAIGMASWYGSDFHGRLTANGEIYDQYAVAAAHPTMPLPSYARVTNISNNKSMIVRINDRGPFHADRILDVSQTVANSLDFKRSGTTKVKVDYIGPASLNGSDDQTLMSTLRQDGLPAQLRKLSSPTLLASTELPRPFLSHNEAAKQVFAANNSDEDIAVNPTPPMGQVPLPPQRPYNLSHAGVKQFAGL